MKAHKGGHGGKGVWKESSNVIGREREPETFSTKKKKDDQKQMTGKLILIVYIGVHSVNIESQHMLGGWKKCHASG